MAKLTENESWIVDAGGVAIQKMTNEGARALSCVERLIHCLWVADYSMRNAGDLDVAYDLYSDFHHEAAQLARELFLIFTHDTFSLSKAALQEQYFERFERVCNEIKCMSPPGPQ